MSWRGKTVQNTVFFLLLLTPPWAYGQSEIHGLQLAPDRPCHAETISIPDCLKMTPKPFTQTERSILKQSLQEMLSASPLAGHILGLVKQRGVKTLRRFSRGPGSAWVNVSDGSINFADSFFERALTRDRQSGFLLTTKILTHEFGHIFDRGYSKNPEFQKLLGFLHNENSHVTDTMAIGVLKTQQTAWLTEYRHKLEQKNWSAAHEFSRARPKNTMFPSVDATISPEEAFAEWFAYAILDQSTKTQTKRIVRWMHNLLVISENNGAQLSASSTN